MKVKEIIALLTADGWQHVRTKGSHRQFRHPMKVNVMTVPGKPSDDPPLGTQDNILKMSELKP